MPQSRTTSDPLTVSPSERTQRSFDQTIDAATQAIEETRAQVARARALSQSEAALAQEINSLAEEHDRLTHHPDGGRGRMHPVLPRPEVEIPRE